MTRDIHYCVRVTRGHVYEIVERKSKTNLKNLCVFNSQRLSLRTHFVLSLSWSLIRFKVEFVAYLNPFWLQNVTAGNMRVLL